MAISVLNQWSAGWGAIDAELVLNPTPGNTLIAVLGYHVLDGSAPMLSLGDVSRNAWTLLSDPFRFASSTHAAAQLQVEIWACPSARYDGWPWLLTYAAAMQMTALDVGSAAVRVFEVAALPGELAVDSVTLATASASTTASVTVPAPAGGADCLMVAAAITDIGTAATPSGTGWTGLTAVTNSNPNVALSSAWREATTGGTVTFTGSSANWTLAAVAIRTAGTPLNQPNPAWPATHFEVGLGYDMATPLSRVRWTRQAKRYQSLDATRGIQAERGVAQQGQANAVLLNYDGAYTPRDITEAATATAAGTTTTILVADASAADIHVADFFHLKTSGGALKELNVFQVTGLSSAAGTTTVTFARADGTAGGAQAATASGDVYAGIAIDLYTPWRLVKHVAGATYVVGSGRLADLQIDFTDPHRSIATGIGVDELETLATVANPSALRGELYRHRGLRWYWPLDDAAGVGYAANQSGVTNAPLTQTASKYGTGSATADFGASTQNVATISTQPDFQTSLLGDQGTGWQQNGITSADMNARKGYALAASDAFPPISGGITIMGAIVHTTDQTDVIIASTTNPTVCILRNGDPGAGVSAGSIIKLSIDRTSFLPVVTVWDKDTHAATATTLSGVQLAGADWRTWALVFTRTSWALYIEGDLQGSGSCDLVNTWTGLEVGGEASQFFNGNCGPGTHAHIAVYERALTPDEVQTLGLLAKLGNTVGVLESGPGRVIRKLGTVGYTGTRVINPDGDGYTAEAAPSGSVFDIVSEVLGYQDGLAFIDAASQVQGRTPGRAYHQSPRAILGDGPGELPFEPGQNYGFLRTFVYNDVEVSNATAFIDQLSSSLLVAVDDTSAARYGARTLPVATRWADNSNAWHLAWWLLGRYAHPRMRVQTVTVSAVASNDVTSPAGRWAFVAGVEIGDIVVINRRPLGQPAISVRCVVLQVETSFKFGDQTSADVTLTLAVAPPRVAVCGDSSLGQLADTVLGV